MANLHVIIGEDDYLVSEAVKRIIGDGDGLEVIDSVNSSNAELQLTDLREADESFSTPPFLEPRKITWWKNVRFLPQSGKGGPSEDVKAALEKFARKIAGSPLPDNQHFVLSGPKLLATSVFAKTLRQCANIQQFSAGKPWEVARDAVARAKDLAEELGLRFEPGVAEAFVARVGVDTRSLASEMSKMRSYLGAKADVITAADVADVSSQGVGVEPEVWSITDAIGVRNVESALLAVSRFEGESGFAVMVTNVVERFFRQLAELKDAQERGKFEVASEGMNPYAAKKMLGFLRNWDLRELRIARGRFMMLREKVVSSSGSADVLVVAEIVRVMRRAGRTRAARI